MKFILATFATLLAGIHALSQYEGTLSGEQQRVSTDSIQRVVDQINQNIRDAGLDPIHVDHRSIQIDAPIGEFGVWVDGFWCTGISHNHFDRLDYAILTSRLRFDFVWDRIVCETRSAGVNFSLFGRELVLASKSGSVEISDLRMQGTLRFSLQAGEGLRGCEIELTADIKSDLKIKFLNQDLSDNANNAVAEWDELLRANKDAISEQLCDLAERLWS